METKSIVKKILSGGSVRELLCEGMDTQYEVKSVLNNAKSVCKRDGKELRESNLPSEVRKFLYDKLINFLHAWGDYIGDYDQWNKFVTDVAKDVWESFTDLSVNESISFKSYSPKNPTKIKSYKFNSVEDLKAAWESGVGVPDNDDPVLDVYIDGKPVYVGAHPESIEPAVLDEVWFEDILTYCDINIW